MSVGRFAPTPSGRMHIGNVYAMLAAWLSTRSAAHAQTAPRGRMLLRIEDVDVARAVPDADRWIMDDLAWLGLDWQGDPVYQSQRTELYEQALRLLECSPSPARDAAELVYPCFCSRTDIRGSAAPNESDGFVIYPGTCRRLGVQQPDELHRRLACGDQHSLRIAMPESHDPTAMQTFVDRVFGEQRFNLARDIGDSVVRRADGVFSYQLAVVVDDLLMGVNDVVRGRDLLRSTALQLWIRRRLIAAGFMDLAGAGGGDAIASRAVDQPQYAHLPLVRSAADRRLAKRDHSTDMAMLRERGVRPNHIIGYCAWLLGIRAGEGGGPIPMTAEEALGLFSWEALRSNPSDELLPSSIRFA